MRYVTCIVAAAALTVALAGCGDPYYPRYGNSQPYYAPSGYTYAPSGYSYAPPGYSYVPASSSYSSRSDY